MPSLFSPATASISPASLSESSFWRNIRKHLNFYRIHILFFTFTPLIFSGIFYASNGRYKISYIDSLFNCVSAMAVCGLATVNLSSLTPWQQTILFIQMCMGSPVVVSWVIVFIRKYYFAKKFQHIIEAEAARKAASLAGSTEHRTSWTRRIGSLFMQGRRLSDIPEESAKYQSNPEKGGFIRKLRPDMIRRMDDAPKPINPSGRVTEERPVSIRRMPSSHSLKTPTQEANSSGLLELDAKLNSANSSASSTKLSRRLSDPGLLSRPPSPNLAPIQRYETMVDGSKGKPPRAFPRTQTIEFAPGAITSRRGRSEQPRIAEYPPVRSIHDRLQSPEARSLRRQSLVQQVPLTSHPTNQTFRTHVSLRNSKNRGFGGFPMPYEILGSLFGKVFPNLGRRLARTVTMPATTSLVSQHAENVAPGAKSVPYISFDAIVGRNSAFHLLTSSQLEEIGGVEYRALNALLWIVGFYHIGIQLTAFTIFAPYLSMARWKNDFIPPQEFRPISPTWFSAFQVISSYTNTGMSLVDQSMVPFQTAYPVVLIMAFLILAGNTAFPVLLRFLIWMVTKCVPKTSRANETLHFLLDHPRRCFISLFPSHQTWFLLTVVLTLTFIDWIFFMILNIGIPEYESIPLNIRFMIGFLQAVAVRSAGFGIIPLASLAPAVKVLYVIMMYISVYPIAMSVRSTNVYEEQSLGVFHDHDSEHESTFQPSGPRMTVWSRYLSMHVRKQLAFDMWWLSLALFLVCIIERGAIRDPASAGWMNIFTILFELVSAYGTVGLSLGIPDQNYSLSGSFQPLSKLIICLVMLRGRHRGLPVAIDRAVMLPSEFEKQDAVNEDTQIDPSAYGVTGTHHPGFDDPEQQHRYRGSPRQRSSERFRRPSPVPSISDHGSTRRIYHSTTTPPGSDSGSARRIYLSHTPPASDTGPQS